MNKQEIEIAIEIIASDKKAFEAVNHGGFTNKIKAFELAISALEQQIPKKPIEEQGISPRCPYCENANYLINEDGEENNHCGDCGQAINWRNEDE